MPTAKAPSREEWMKYEKSSRAKQQEFLHRYEDEFVKVPITDSDNIQEGDHLVAEGELYDHHMLVTEKIKDEEKGGQVKIIEYTGSYTRQPAWLDMIREVISASSRTVASNDLLAQGKIRENSHPLQYFVDHKIQKIIWPDELRQYSVDQAIKRARSRKGETYYDALRNNCEHFVTWCICGLRVSLQVKRWSIALYSFIAGPLDWCIKKAKDAGIPLLLKIAANASDELAGWICENSELIGFGLAIAIEAGMAGYNIYRAFHHCKTTSEFFVELFNIVAKAVCRLGFGIVGSYVGAAAGGPLLSFVLGAAGAGVGHLIAHWIGWCYENCFYWDG